MARRQGAPTRRPGAAAVATVLLGGLGLALGAGCSAGGARPTAAGPAPPPSAAPPPSSAAASVGSPAPMAALPPRDAGATTVPAGAPPTPAHFPPASLAPPHSASAQAGDGIWVAMGDPGKGEALAVEPRTAYVTVLHPHRVSRWKKLTVVALDLTRIEVHYVPGANDVDAATVTAAGLRRPLGLVERSDVPALLAIFNGGFQPRHGRWGMKVEDAVLVPPRPEGCTVALRDDGTVRIGTHSTLDPELERIASYRQTPPCLVEADAIHPRLLARDERPWGGHNPKDITRRRSAVGVDASGRLLLYGMGEELEPSELAAGMHAAGARDAAELDINWSWTRFLLVGGDGPDVAITSTLIPQMVYDRGAYLDRPAARDFFYLTRRAAPPP